MVRLGLLVNVSWKTPSTRPGVRNREGERERERAPWATL